MDIDVSLAGDSLPINVENPHHMDTESVVGRIGEFLQERGVPHGDLALAELLPKMVKGIAGCEGGCPANAQSLVRKGFGKYHLEYIEGGILTAKYEVSPGRSLEIKMFPDF